MSLKNYYAMLGVPQTATQDELRHAYRALAKKYHPDAVPDNPYAAAHFAEISTAYEVLSNPSKRAAYDEERWLRGLSTRSKKAVRITPEWIRNESHRLRTHMAGIDTYRMNHAALRDYILALLSDEHLSVLQSASDDMRADILNNILASVARLHFGYAPETAARLKLLAAGNDAMMAGIEAWETRQAYEIRWNRYRPIIVLVATALLCVFVWWLSRRH
jgi:curved DNA-binding protein CbpA